MMSLGNNNSQNALARLFQVVCYTAQYRRDMVTRAYAPAPLCVYRGGFPVDRVLGQADARDKDIFAHGDETTITSYNYPLMIPRHRASVLHIYGGTVIGTDAGACAMLLIQTRCA